MATFDPDNNFLETSGGKTINAQKPRRDMWIPKKYGLPFMSWNLMLKGKV